MPIFGHSFFELIEQKFFMGALETIISIYWYSNGHETSKPYCLFLNGLGPPNATKNMATGVLGRPFG